MKLVEGEGFYRLVPVHTAGNYTPNKNQPILFETEDELMQYFKDNPSLIEYSLIKVVNCRIE